MAASKVTLADGRSITVYDTAGAKSARRVYSSELGGYVSRRQTVIASTGFAPGEKTRYQANPLYWRNAAKWAAARGVTAQAASRDPAFNALQRETGKASRRKDYQRLSQLLAQHGYDLGGYDDTTGES